MEPDLPRAYMLKCINCVQHRDERGAFEALQRYFDYAVRYGGANPNALADRRVHAQNPRTAALLYAGRREEPVKIQDKHAQYAIVHKGALHWNFGQLDACARSVDECIRLAQEYSNNHGIAVALIWLYTLMGTTSHHKAAHILSRVATTCDDMAVRTHVHDLQTNLALTMAKVREAVCLADPLRCCNAHVK